MKYVKRQLESHLSSLAKGFPIVSVTGPRQSGKTTMLKHYYKHLPYVNFEFPDTLHLAQQDPRSFIEAHINGAILDEVQQFPELFSYLQGYSDQHPDATFVLSGSQNYLLNERISQTLAGRVAILRLLPFSVQELSQSSPSHTQYESWDLIYKGFYPRLYEKNINLQTFYSSYLQTYIERDVALLRNISQSRQFRNFLRLLAARVGQLLNYSSLANDLGVSVNTVKDWISVLEASYTLYLLQPYHNNFNKRMIKSPKIYFTDTGLLCHLLNISDANALSIHPFMGGIFENFIIMEITKSRWNSGILSPMHFWHDSKGHEVDLLIEDGQQLHSIEIKAGKTYSPNYFKNLKWWLDLTGVSAKNAYVVYNGTQENKTAQGQLINWRNVAQICS